MKLLVNDMPHEFLGETLEDLVLELGKNQQGIAIAIDLKVIPKSMWASTALTEHSQVFIFESIAGG